MQTEKLVIDRKTIPAIPRPVYAFVAERDVSAIRVAIMSGGDGMIYCEDFTSHGRASFVGEVRYWLEGKRRECADPGIWSAVCEEVANRIDAWATPHVRRPS